MILPKSSVIKAQQLLSPKLDRCVRTCVYIHDLSLNLVLPQIQLILSPTVHRCMLADVCVCVCVCL